VTDRPIIFSAPMVRALLDGRKTQTRRLRYVKHGAGQQESVWVRVQPGDRLWVRESVRYDWARGGGAWILRADDTGLLGVRGRTLETPTPHRWPTGSCPSIHMPRWASRITLTVTEVRRQLLQDISEEDATAEGARTAYGEPFDQNSDLSDHRRFHLLWTHLHGADAWDANPEVVALTFTVARRNIDLAQGMEPEAETRSGLGAKPDSAAPEGRAP
jgi:hypothetical protein